MEQIRLDIIPKGLMPVCHSSQYDKGRVIRLNLVDGLQGYTLTDETVTLNVRKPDNNIVTAGVNVVSGASYVDIVTTEQMTACEGENLCEIVITKGDVKIASLNFKMKVEVDPLKDGIESETEIHNLETQIAEIDARIVPPIVAEEVSNQYDSENVIFDDHPTAGHGTGYVVKSENVPAELNDLDDVAISGQAQGEALVWNGAEWVNGTVSTVGSIDDLNDVDTTGKANADSLRYNATAQEWEAKPTTVEMTSAEWEAIADKQAWRNAHKNTHLVLTDAPNLNETAKQISYDGSTDTVWDKVESKANESGVAISKSTNFIGVDYNVTAYSITTSSSLPSAVQIRYKYDGNLLTLCGRIVLDITSRTGANGGVIIALKSGKKIKNDIDTFVGVSTYLTEERYGEATILQANANSRSFRICASESYANVQSGKTLVLYVPPLSIELADT